LNVRMILRSLGKLFYIEAACMAPSLAVSLIYGQDDFKAFTVTMVILLAAGFALHRVKPATTDIYTRDGFAIVSLGWIFVSFFGALPFVFSGAIPSFADAYFETVSGFTTTGASILKEIETLPRGILFWRSFTNWIGGMGVLVLALAVMPSVKASSFHIMKAESPGPDIEKLVPKLGQTAKILYMIYFFMTAVLVVLLVLTKMPLYDSLCHAFGTAGTGGFSVKDISIGSYDNVGAEIIIAIFMFAFGTNFALYYHAIKGNFKSFPKDTEFRLYLGIVLVSIFLVTLDINGKVFGSVWESLRHSSFQVSSVITTTGYSSVDFDLWPSFSKSILVMLMFIGASAGSTGGGIKVIRVLLLLKSVRRRITKIIHPRSVYTIKVGGRAVDEDMLSGVNAFFFAYILVFALTLLIISLDGKDMVTNFTAVTAAINNIGPGLGIVGPMGSYSNFSVISKAVLSFCMIAGRLEIYPMLLLLTPTFWKRASI
jgi:trk system potassium uptake protein TrkH